MPTKFDKYFVNIYEVTHELRSIWIKSNRSLYNTTAFTKKKETGANLMMCCPFHAENRPSFGITLDFPYKYNCFTCGSSGNLINLVSYVLNVNYFSALSYISKYYSYLPIDTNVGTKLETDFTRITEEEIYEYRKKRHSYIEQRGLSDYTLQKYEIGYDEVTNSITFPVRDFHNNPLFFIKRSVNSKFFNITTGAPKDEVLYGLNYIVNSPQKITELYLVEGTIDTLSCYESGIPAVGVIGRMLLKKQLKQLIRADIKKVNLFLDNDRWGVTGALKTYKMLKDTSIKVNVVLYPKQWGVDKQEEIKYKDPNDLLLSGMLNKIEVVPFIDYYLILLKSKELKEVINNEFRTKEF